MRQTTINNNCLSFLKHPFDARGKQILHETPRVTEVQRNAAPKRHLPPRIAYFCVLAAVTVAAGSANADFVGPYDLSKFTLSNTDGGGFPSFTDGLAVTPDGGLSLVLSGGNSGSGLPGDTDFTISAPEAGSVLFDYSYSSLDVPGADFAGYLLNGVFTQLADTDGETGSIAFAAISGDIFGFRVSTLDNEFEPGILTVSAFNAPGGGSSIPEPSNFGAVTLSGVAGLLVFMLRRRRRQPAPSGNSAIRSLPSEASPSARRYVDWGWVSGLTLCICATAAPSLFAQSQTFYTGVNVTGQLALRGTVNFRSPAVNGALVRRALLQQSRSAPETHLADPTLNKPKLPRQAMAAARFAAALAAPAITSLPVTTGTNVFGFNGLTHLEQRNADGGNQFSTEPPSPQIAAANGFILEGVNDAVQIYTASGSPLLAAPLSSNQVFGLPHQIDRTTLINGPFLTDMRVFFDADIQRWMILQRGQDNDADGNELPSSHEYLAVSQTTDPAGMYSVYVIDTTNSSNFRCPCISDFPQIGADHYGIYISTDEYDTALNFVEATVLAISKASLAAGTADPTAYMLEIPFSTGFEFAIQPATTPPGASYFLASGGAEYFVSTQAAFSTANSVALWALTNTSSLQTSAPNLTMIQTTVPTLTYRSPDVATQRPGPLPYGSTVPPGLLAFIDGGDARVLSLVYAGGRLYVTLASEVTDGKGRNVVGGAYLVVSPALRSGTLLGSSLRQGFLVTNGNHLLRPAIAVNARGQGAIAFTIVGPDYFPSAGFVSFDNFAPGTSIKLAAAGFAPEDGFSGYPDGFGPGLARWGDYSGAVVNSDGNLWMVAEYIPNLPRSDFANWGTYVMKYIPGTN